MRYYKRILVCLFTIIFLFSCNSQEIVYNRAETELPVKLLVSEKHGDSTIINIMIPQIFDLKNNSNSVIRLVLTSFSIDGSNYLNSNGSRTYAIKDSLVNAPNNINFSKRQKERFNIYVSYRAYLSNKEKEDILKKGTFVQLKHKKKVYNIDSTKEIEKFVNKKIADSLKGYINLKFRNTSTKKWIVKNIPVKF